MQNSSLRCFSCGKVLTKRPKTKKQLTKATCDECLEPSSISNKMILIEIKEHEHLLKLYQAVYNEQKDPSQTNFEKKLQRLEECNHFFSGGFECP